MCVCGGGEGAESHAPLLCLTFHYSLKMPVILLSVIPYSWGWQYNPDQANEIQENCVLRDFWLRCSFLIKRQRREPVLLFLLLDIVIWECDAWGFCNLWHTEAEKVQKKSCPWWPSLSHRANVASTYLQTACMRYEKPLLFNLLSLEFSVPWLKSSLTDPASKQVIIQGKDQVKKIHGMNHDIARWEKYSPCLFNFVPTSGRLQ